MKTQNLLTTLMICVVMTVYSTSSTAFAEDDSCAIDRGYQLSQKQFTAVTPDILDSQDLEGKSVLYWDATKKHSGQPSVIDQDSYIYTQLILNFLELSFSLITIDQTHDDTPFETRWRLFFLQLRQSTQLNNSWQQLVSERIPPIFRGHYTGRTQPTRLTDHLNTRSQRNSYISAMAKLLVELGEIQLLDYQLSYTNLTSIIEDPFSNERAWRNLLRSLVHWHFEKSLETVAHYLCSKGTKHFIIVIPPSPLMEYFAQELSRWSRNSNLKIDLSLLNP